MARPLSSDSAVVVGTARAPGCPVPVFRGYEGGFAGDPAAVDIATRQASFEFMRGHASQFDEHLLRDARDAACGLPPGAATTKVREAGVDSQALSLALREALDAAWRQVIEARFGYATYADMRAALRDG